MVRLFLFILKTTALLLILVTIVAILWLFNTIVVTEKTVSESPLQPRLAIATTAEWEARVPEILDTFSNNMYGPVPRSEVPWELKKVVLEENAFGGRASYELWTLQAPESDLVFNIVALFPNSERALPLLVGSNFCPNHTRFPAFDIPKPISYPSMCGGDTFLDPLITRVFGEYIDTFPFERFVDEGIVFANIYLGEGVSDSEEMSTMGLEQVSAATGEEATGALAAWAWSFIETVRVFESDIRIDPNRTALYGHSRDGKAALIAAAYSDRIDLVLAHQSGKGGAAPWQTGTGETIEAIMGEYPYWFDSNFESYKDTLNDLSVDQHLLISTIAPRPVLLSAATWDKWGDPVGVLEAANTATAVYELYNASGTASAALESTNLQNELAYFIRPYFHGVRPTDWDAFFEFLEAHF